MTTQLLAPGENLKKFLDSKTIADSKNELIRLSLSGELTAESLKSNFSEVDNYIQANGISFEELTQTLNSSITEVPTSFDVLKTALQDVTSEYDRTAAAKTRYDSIMSGDDYNSGFIDQCNAYKAALEDLDKGEAGKHFWTNLEYLFGENSYTWDIDTAREQLTEYQNEYGVIEANKKIQNCF